jgi:3-hydroxymyristoyl/3-hydroxydecanoyl-(acyl carrier protein) dehydratase
MNGLLLRVKLQIPPTTHPMFAGHFPDRPVVPGAWLLAQAIRALETAAGASLAWHHVESAKFRVAIQPGACLDLTLIQSGSSGLQLNISQGGEPVASVRFGTV